MRLRRALFKSRGVISNVFVAVRQEGRKEEGGSELCLTFGLLLEELLTGS